MGKSYVGLEGRAWLPAVLKVTEGAVGEDRKDYFVLVWDFSKGV